MSLAIKKEPSALMIVTAFAILYIVWGSTYLFIQMAIETIPPFIMGAMRFVTAGLIMMIWCRINGEKLFNKRIIKHASITGFFLLFMGTGAVIFAEKTLPSSLVAVLIASQAIWLVLFDRRNWKQNFTNKNTIIGLVIGFIGVLLLFRESAANATAGAGITATVIGFVVLLVGMFSWSGGSIYSKYTASGSPTVNSAWQMFAGGLAFLPASLINREWGSFDWSAVSTNSWLSVLYLITMGSLAGFSAYVWLLRVRPVTQVSTHVYVNPVVAVLLGVLFAGEKMTALQFVGLGIILTSVLLINLSRYRAQKQAAVITSPVNPERKIKAVTAGKAETCVEC
jgi:drug/metabolite transporter (DMT)-like permease